MNLPNQLSIKSALRFALPGLAACLFLAACSNEISDVTPENLPSETVGTVRFSASTPLASEDVATRIGIDNDNKPSVDEWTKDEPVVWIGDEEVSVFFVSKADGDEIHAKFKIDGDGKSADLVNVTDLNHLNGEYEIYAFTPYVQGNTLSQAQLSLANQSQAANTTDYSHLSKSAYMRAAGVNATFNAGSLTSSAVNFHFEHVTSFLRFNITNELGKDITVNGISVYHPNMITEASYNIQDKTQSTTNDGSAIALTFGASGQTLSAGSSFDAYMSTLTVPLGTNFDKELVLTIYVAGDSDPFAFSVLPEDLYFTSTNGMFAPSTRFMFELVLSNNLPTDPNLPTSDYLTYNNYIITWKAVADESIIELNNADGIWVAVSSLAMSCPDGYTTLTNEFFSSDADRLAFLTSSTSPLRGVWDFTASQMNDSHRYIFLLRSLTDTRLTRIDLTDGGAKSYVGAEWSWLRPICYRPLPLI
jgi:hypothetical protein